MRRPSCFALWLLSMVVSSLGGNHTMDSSSYLMDGDTLVSAEGRFKLGFFSAGNSESRFLGIWYSTAPDTVIWVANRENPLKGSSGVLEFGDDGNVVLLDWWRTVFWSSNMSRTLRYPALQILDSGNLVLGESSSLDTGDYSWQSFDYPSDTILAGLRVGWDLRSGFERFLTSWKAVDDPAPGEYTYRYDLEGLPQAVIEKGSVRRYRSGPWNGVQFTGIAMTSSPVSILQFVYNNTDVYFEFQSTSEEFVSKVTLDPSGFMHCMFMTKGSSGWKVRDKFPSDPCDKYGKCGANSFCRLKLNLRCECLPGFLPKSQEEWETLNHDGGCIRKIPLNCSNEGFQKVSRTNLPDLKNFRLDKNMSLRDCRDKCYNDCSCTAYANSDVRNGGSGCLMWFGDLLDIKELQDDNHNTQDVFIRLSDSSLIHDLTQKRKLVIASATSIAGLLMLVLTAGTVVWKVRTRRGLKTWEYGADLPSFSFPAIAAATDNFSDVNFIGEGGFGSVYKGHLSMNREVAVKRLSKNSGQGLEEFTNEVILIARLQHKNLVGLVGCCIEKTERMLIYEYMPNKSLDYFIFDRAGRCSLTWERRYSIVCGIARGLVYLHHDSKLPVVHRDLKASNILLDGDLNPKISDFGLARIFTGNDKATTTRRIIGSHGYMSPEYAIEGEFSMKSDVYSFGVLLLEIVSGRRNVGFRHPDHQHNLLGHVWLLWLAGRVLELVDEPGMELSEPQAERCIHVGLLCVQKLPVDRPSMEAAMVMLANEGAELPQPKQPGFFQEQIVSGAKECYPHTYAVATMTLPQGR